MEVGSNPCQGLTYDMHLKCPACKGSSEVQKLSAAERNGIRPTVYNTRTIVVP